MSTTTPPSLPDGWDFPPEFLDDPEHLPPYVPSHDSALLGPSRRATASAVAPWFRRGSPQPDERQPHTIALDGVHVLVDDRQARRHRLLGPSRLVLSEELQNRHLLFVGPPGVGKTSMGVLPLTASLLADRGRTVVVFDPKGDQFPVIRDLCRDAGRPRGSVLRLNLSDPKGSLGWNPLRAGMSRTEAHGFASTLVHASEGKHSADSPFWRNTSIDVLVAIALGLVGDPEETLTLPRVQEIVELPRAELLEWLKQHEARKFASFLESGSHNAETCLTDTSMRLVSLLDLDLCAVLSHGELQIDRLFTRPTVLVVEMDETRLERLRPIFNLLVQQILDRAIAAASRRPDARLRFPASLVIDEFGSAIGAIPRFPVYLNTLRSRRVSIVAAVQSLSQIASLYGSEAGPVLVGFSSKVFFPNVEYADAEAISIASGTMTLLLPPEQGSPAIWTTRRVYLPEEIARPRTHPVLGRPVTMSLADGPPLQVYLTPSYRLPQLHESLRRHRRRRSRPLRRQPLVYAPTGPAANRSSAFTDVRGMVPATILRLLSNAERRAGLSHAPEAMQRTWLRWRRESFDGPAPALRFVEELVHRRLHFVDLHAASEEARSDRPEVLLKYLDFVLARRAAEWSAQQPF